MRALVLSVLTAATLAGGAACSSSDTAATSTSSTAGSASTTGSSAGGGSASTADSSASASSSSSSGSGGSGSSTCSGPKPGPSTTGVPAGTKLTPSGSIKVMEKGAVIEDLDVTGSITVLADDVTIRRVHLKSDDYYPIRYFDNDNTGLVVEDSEIEGTTGDVTSAISFANYTARRLNIHGSSDGLKADANVLIEDCWIHDLSNGPGEHNDDVQSTGGKGVTIRHSVLEGASNAAVQTGDEGGASTEDLLIECSWLSGGGYTLNIRGSGATAPKNTKVIDNRFGRDAGYGPWTFDDPSPTVTGNVYDDDSQPIPYP
jgi:hypothetical protein